MTQDDRKIALVTGATRGLGLETVRQLAAKGVRVLLGARNLEAGEAKAAKFRADGFDVQAIALDLDDAATVERAAKTIEAKYGRLDILINNAGIFLGGDGVTSSADFQAIQRTFNTNFLGTVMVTQAMLPLVKKSRQGRIVNVSSTIGSLAVSADPNSADPNHAFLGYAASKAALNMMTVQLAHELRNTSVKVNSICPGFVKTDMNNGEGAVTVEEGVTATMRYALLGEDGPSGGFFDSSGHIPW